MKTIYCSDCGKKLRLINTSTTTKFNTETGKPYIISYTVYMCADYEEGFSDREWHVHDRVVITESTEDVK